MKGGMGMSDWSTVAPQKPPDQQVAMLFGAANPVTSTELEAWLREIPLPNRAGSRTFTPFVGYGAVQSGPLATDPAQADCLRWDGGLDALIGEGPAAAELSKFLERLARQREDGRLRVRFVELRQPVTELRYACLELAYAATLVLVDAWYAQPSPVCDWHLHEVTLSASDRDRLSDALEESVERCLDVRQLPGADPELLGLAGLMARFAASRTELESGVLSGTLVEWFTDVFWHTMIFDSAVYPRIGELTTQVSLMMGSAEPRKHVIPISRVQRGDYNVLVEAVKKSLGRGVEPTNVSAARKAFLDSLADVSNVAYNEWDRRIQRGMPASRGPLSTPQPAILLTTTLGLDLEFAFARVDRSRSSHSIFHVAVPVVVDYGSPGKPHRATLRWLVGDFPVNGTEANRASVTRPEMGWRWLHHWGAGTDGNGFPELKGPLLLKVAGSPLHDLRPGLGTIGEDERREIDQFHFPGERNVERVVSHAVTLDEFDVIQRTAFELVEMGEQVGSRDRVRWLPKWLLQSINSHGRWWVYLGLRLTDWNSRMEFVLNRILMAPHSKMEKPVLIGRNIRPDQSRILSLLGIEPVTGDCFELTSSLRDLASQIPTKLDSVVTGGPRR